MSKQAPRLSVILSSSDRREARIARSRMSLASQTLAPDMVEILETEPGGGARACNAALNSARGEYVTFLEAGDVARPRLLEVLAEAAASGTIAVAAMGHIDGDAARPEFDTAQTRALLPHLAAGADNAALCPALFAGAAAVVSTALARRVGFRTPLTAHERTVLWVELLTTAPVQIVFSEWAADAACLRDVSAAAIASAPSAREVAEAEIALRDLPVDTGAAMRVLRLAQEHLRRTLVGTAREVVFLGSAPARDTSGRALVQRLRETAVQPVDVVRQQREDTFRETAVGVPLDTVVSGDAPTDLTWADFAVLARTVRGALDEGETVKPGPYLAARSISAGPVDHLLAALFKIGRPSIRWSAEMVLGDRRDPIAGARTTVEGDSCFQILGAGLLEAGYPVEEVPEQMERFAEMVTLGLADELKFESEEHAELVLARCPVPEIVTRARRVMNAATARQEVLA